jgi:hypothetical protein
VLVRKQIPLTKTPVVLAVTLSLAAVDRKEFQQRLHLGQVVVAGKQLGKLT